MFHIALHACKGVTRTLAVLTFIAAALVSQAANHYVLLKDGRLHVFPDECISEMVTNSVQVTFTALDGAVYSYPLSIVQTVVDYLPKELPTMTSYKFNNKYNYQVVTDALGIINENSVSVDVIGIGKRLTASFNLSDSRAVAFVDDKEQKSHESRMRFDRDKVYTVCFYGDLILKANGEGKWSLKPYGTEYTVHVNFLTDQSTMVPRIDINTVGGVNISSKDYYLDAEIIIDGAGVFPSMTDSVQIKGRGNSSWSSDPDAKNPYRLKFDHKVKPLGLTKGKNWVLLANKIPASMLTNAIGMKAASLMHLPAVNHIIPVELYVNGTYKGSYNFTEKVGFSNNSVDIVDETAAVLLELDKYYDEDNNQKFVSSPYGLPVNIKEPTFSEGTTALTLKTIKNHFNSFLNGLNSGEDISTWVDLDMLARYLMLNEFLCNYEVFHPKSTYLYNENLLADTSKFIFGPAWDLDYCYGYQTNSTYYNCDPGIDFCSATTFTLRQFFMDLMQNEQVTNRMFNLWKDFMLNGIDELYEFCTDYVQYANPSLMNNRTVTTDRVNYPTQAVRAANWLYQRANYLHAYYKKLYYLPGDVNGDRVVNIDDLTALIDYLLSGLSHSETIYFPDVDENGVTSINDVTTLIDKLLSE